VKKIAVLLLWIVATGCSSAPVAELGPDHPASPEAAEVPLKSVTKALSMPVEAPQPPDESPDHGVHHVH